MRFTRYLATLILATVFIAGFDSPAHAEAEEFSAEDLALIKSFPLTTDFLQKWTAVNQDTTVLSCNVYALNLTAETIDDRAKEYDARPGVHAVLANNGLTAREVVLGTTTLAVVGLQVLREKFKWLDDDAEQLPVNETNVKFYWDHYEEIRKLDKMVQKHRVAKRPKGADCPKE